MTLPLSKKHDFDMVFDSQKVFRLILDAMANPARVVNIKEYADKLYGSCPVFLAVAITLLDNETAYNVCGSRELSEEIVSLTHARSGPLESADFIFICDQKYIEEVIESAKCGTLADPHKSATVFIVNDEEPARDIKLSGPGLAGPFEVRVSRAVEGAIRKRDGLCYEYPQGIDLIFLSSGGELFAIPRLTSMEVK